MEGDNFGREKDKAVPFEVKQEQKNAKGGRWSVLSPSIFTSAKRHSIHFTGDRMDLGASADGFGKSHHTGFSAPEPAGRSE
jgi:hypothetical protein